MQKEKKAVGISFPTDILRKIDEERGDVPRSLFVLRLLDTSFIKKKSIMNGKRKYSYSQGSSLPKPSPSESIIGGQ